MNIPTYTMSSKIYSKISDILYQVKMKKQNSDYISEIKFDSKKSLAKKQKQQMPLNTGLHNSDIYS